jgi:hypothetical protein
VRLFLRLTRELNDRLRRIMRYHGELSRYIEEALTSSDLGSIELVPDGDGRSRGITAVISHSANARLRSVARQRGCTVRALANSALKEWLGGHNAR